MRQPVRRGEAGMAEDLTQHSNVGVRWQAQMEEHLSSVRTLTSEAMLPGIDPAQASFRAQLAQAHAASALALAVSNVGGDLELQTGAVAEKLGLIADVLEGA
jgi:hypothetical protein